MRTSPPAFQCAYTLRSGDAGNNILIGGPGSDTLNGQLGNDWLIGGPGADVFEITDLAFGYDDIIGWQDGQDLLDLTALGQGFDDFYIGGYSNTVIQLNSAPHHYIILVGINPANINSADFA